jgi:hypothetical protein
MQVLADREHCATAAIVSGDKVLEMRRREVNAFAAQRRSYGQRARSGGVVSN